jgi:3-hydroxybutyryl-CoA dehydrogenase
VAEDLALFIDRINQVTSGPSVCVIGAGTMGSGIAQTIAQSGMEVSLVDRTDQDLSRAQATIRNSLNRLLKKGAITETAASSTIERLTLTTRLDSIAQSSVVIEAIFEDFGAKSRLFNQIDNYVTDEAVLASNTSSISISALASLVSRPERVVGMHFFNPVALMPLVEIVRGLQTSDAVVEVASDLARRIGKQPVRINDAPGFVANRILIPMVNEAVVCLESGVAGRDEIDTIMTLGASHPMGPLALADLIGLDVCLSIMEVLHRDLGEDKYRPSPLLRRMVAAGKLGRKTGEGFYVYHGAA